jgi:hypothetical protein
MGMIGPPDEVYTDPQVVHRTLQALQHHPNGSSMAQPSREQLLVALTSTPAGVRDLAG